MAMPMGVAVKPSPRRILLWVLVGGLGLFLVVTGIVGILAKGG